ncbi:hypothetical protein QC762_205526 [Podospora pseudocomata]|uniref:Uncharacterized protein n=1 Tax=Podospora pseudocomata TaxID=2093779 RepID=A0ABR0GLQ8_9PEZI|nr:hypothetical protein QC762_205526 [Podospora pseudocomata]
MTPIVPALSDGICIPPSLLRRHQQWTPRSSRSCLNTLQPLTLHLPSPPLSRCPREVSSSISPTTPTTTTTTTTITTTTTTTPTLVYICGSSTMDPLTVLVNSTTAPVSERTSLTLLRTVFGTLYWPWLITKTVTIWSLQTIWSVISFFIISPTRAVFNLATAPFGIVIHIFLELKPLPILLLYAAVIGFTTGALIVFITEQFLALTSTSTSTSTSTPKRTATPNKPPGAMTYKQQKMDLPVTPGSVDSTSSLSFGTDDDPWDSSATTAVMSSSNQVNFLIPAASIKQRPQKPRLQGLLTETIHEESSSNLVISYLLGVFSLVGSILRYLLRLLLFVATPFLLVLRVLYYFVAIGYRHFAPALIWDVIYFLAPHRTVLLDTEQAFCRWTGVDWRWLRRRIQLTVGEDKRRWDGWWEEWEFERRKGMPFVVGTMYGDTRRGMGWKERVDEAGLAMLDLGVIEEVEGEGSGKERGDWDERESDIAGTEAGGGKGEGVRNKKKQKRKKVKGKNEFQGGGFGGNDLKYLMGEDVAVESETTATKKKLGSSARKRLKKGTEEIIVKNDEEAEPELTSILNKIKEAEEIKAYEGDVDKKNKKKRGYSRDKPFSMLEQKRRVSKEIKKEKEYEADEEEGAGGESEEDKEEEVRERVEETEGCFGSLFR